MLSRNDKSKHFYFVLTLTGKGSIFTVKLDVSYEYFIDVVIKAIKISPNPNILQINLYINENKWITVVFSNVVHLINVTMT